MTVYDFLDYCIDPGLLTVEIYDCDSWNTVWVGHGDDVPEEFGYKDVGSFNVPYKVDTITLNIC